VHAGSAPGCHHAATHVLAPLAFRRGKDPLARTMSLGMEAEPRLSVHPRTQPDPADAVARLRLVFLYSPTSGHCRRTDAHLAQTLQRRKNRSRFEVVRVNVDERPDLAERFQVDAVPTLVVIEDRRVVKRIVSPDTALDLARSLKPWLR
jgi:thiol-disulfide isomerase/thioredoxin